ncbi:ABC transporter ATP-binding protein [Salipiger marinus]|uniref:Oligopeptide transport system ATP-binding protein n=1 Tax=Salipiger marinus TaxID=555512 RepID=A0A1G8KXV4_9RHOB|nr:dipeptide ABC transporter ATP-binding protein [Salipiger marinus]SDI48209.1 oligopeptide transport system ATP-binding protein [Salipiger marinus]
MSVLVKIENLTKTFADTSMSLGPKRPPVRAVDGVSFEVMKGEALAVVGESGCGKSTLGRLLLHLIQPDSGKIDFEGEDLNAMGSEQIRRMRQRMQMVFQDPFGSLSPRRTIADIIAEPMDAFGLSGTRKERREKVAELLRQVGLPPAYMDRKPRQFSGGQRQRIGIARAISVDPAFIVADEPVSALDVSIQAQIINLMQDLQESKGFSYLFIAHDLAVVRHIADRVAVMYLGRIVELGTKEQIYSAPHHPYTEALLSAAPHPDPSRRTGRIILEGDVPSPTNVPSGCAFRTRCPLAQDRCAKERPALREVEPGRVTACHFAMPHPIANRSTAA